MKFKDLKLSKYSTNVAQIMIFYYLSNAILTFKDGHLCLILYIYLPRLLYQENL